MDENSHVCVVVACRGSGRGERFGRAVPRSTWQVASGGLSLQVNSTYSYELMDSSTQQVLLSEDALSFVVGGTTYSAQSLSNVTVGTDTDRRDAEPRQRRQLERQPRSSSRWPTTRSM